jgi:hypothetical protein
MIAAEAECQLSMYTTLTEYAVYDASLVISDFARESLLAVYSDSRISPSQAQLHRALAVRLVSKGGALGSRFMWLMLKDFRDPHVPDRLQAVPSPVEVAAIAYLERLVRIECKEVVEQLSGLLTQDDRSFIMADSPLTPLRFARNLNLALQMQDFSEAERELVLRSWAGAAFASAMERTYQRYIKVVSGWSVVTLQTHQDFVDTWPMQLAPHS